MDKLGAFSDGPMAREKSLKKKKSIPKLFILGRRKSTKSRPSSPTEADVPALPTHHNHHGQKAVDSGYMKDQSLRTSASSHSQQEDEPLQEVDGNIVKEKEYSPREMDGRDEQKTNKPTNFTKPLETYGTSPHYDETRSPLSQHPVLPEDQPPTHPPRRSSKRIAPPRPPFSATRSKRASTVSSPVESPSGLSIPSRPRTATQGSVPERGKDSPHYSPLLVASARKASYENLKPQRPPNTDTSISWNPVFTQDEARGSMRSALSTVSSALDSGSSGSTKHSSVFTKMSSVSDNTIDMDDLDDYIDLYTGRNEEFDINYSDSIKSPDDAEIRRRSMKIAEAMNDSIGSALTSPASNLPERPSSASIISGEVFNDSFSRPPSMQEQTSTHDQYGFRKYSRDISIAQYDAWHTEYVSIQSRRTAKWISFMHSQGLSTNNPTQFPPSSPKVQRYIQKGLPPAWRGEAWFFYAGGNAYLNKEPHLYTELVARSLTSDMSHSDKESIERDLHRTFPDNIHFKPEAQASGTETPLLSSLRRVLSAFAIHHPRIGYCQSLNFIAGLLLLFLPEEKAFWMLHIITTSYLPGTHELSLEGANVDLWVLMLALKDTIPGIWAKVGGEVQPNSSRLPPISLCTTSWFMSLFIGTLPIESVLRVWDVLFYEGSRTLFRVALAIFKIGENEIRSVNDPMEIFQVVQGLPRKMISVGGLLDQTCNQNTIKQRWVDKKRKERKEWYALERAAEKTRKISRDMGRKDSEVRLSKETTTESTITEEDQPPPPEPVLQTARSKGNAWWPARIGIPKSTTQ